MRGALTSALLLLAAAFTAAAEIEIRGTNFANWFVKGEPVVFKAAQPLPEGKTLTVTLFDSAGKKLKEETLSSADFNRRGWQYQAPSPGFYEVEFTHDNAPVRESWSIKINKQDTADKRKYTLMGEKEFHAVRHAFTVAPAKTPEPAEISPHFGASPHFSMFRKEVPLVRLIGCRSIRIHALRWDELEKEKGKINWRPVDDFMALARESGWRDEEIIFNIYGTPRWASTRPEADWINIFIREYISVVPKDLADWQNFICEVMRRYPKVVRYELWNEPHLVGFSCFWADSVENFVKLLKAGYETVKAEKPEAIVWLGGIGMRYLPFYDEFLKAGGGKYYDVLPLHGSWVRPEPFHELEKKYGIPPKPVVSSEWHAMLLKPMMADYPSEQLLARNMLLDFLNQIRAGVTEVDLFCFLNLAKVEKETLAFHREHRSNNTHVSGLFRHYPYIQPRYPALAWHVFTTQVKGQLKVGQGYLLGDVRVLFLASESGPMLLVWNAGEKSAPLPPELKAAIGAKTRVLSAEGAELPKDFRLDPEVYYFLRDPLAADWKNPGEVLYAQNAKPELVNKFGGVYRRGRLFDTQLNTVTPASLVWQPVEQLVLYDKNLDPGKVKARFAAGFTPEALELLVEIDDPTHVMKANDMRVWEFDSLQFAIDTAGEGFDTARMEFAAALGEDGKAALWKVFVPNLGGDLPGRFTPAEDKVGYGRCRIDRENGKTTYRVSLDASELNPFRLDEQPKVRFALLVNNNDGKGRASYLEWGSGIGAVKDPRQYGNLTPQVPPGTVCGQEALKNKSWSKDYELEFRTEGGTPSVKVIGSSPLASGVTTGGFAIVPGAAYRVRLEARGNARFQVLAHGKSFKRIDLVLPTPLTGEWKSFDLKLIIPPGSPYASINCFAWQQPGCEFEIRNFSVTPL